MSKTYKAYGLIIESEYNLDALEEISAGTTPDIRIKNGQVPEELEDCSDKGPFFQINPREYLLKLPRIAGFYVAEGREVLVRKAKEGNDKDVIAFLLSSVIAALLVQRGFLLLHASVIELDGEVVAFAGRSGAGKSTMATYLHKKGYRVLADDIAVIKFEKNIPYVLSGILSVKLWKDMMQTFDLDPQHPVREGVEKYFYRVVEQEQKPVALNKMVVIGIHNKEDYKVEAIKGIMKFNLIKRNTFRYRLLKGMEKQQEHFKQANQLAGKISLYHLVRPRTKAAAEKSFNHLQEYWDHEG